ncbi:MAG TPA: hypothetical protein VMV33_13500 [Rhodocyclaceae bacterium]|nr:hypothetical protein [Rhodocyclaceae bacterium]
MDFTARLRRHSATWNLWHGARRTGGVLCGVRFAWAIGDEYVTGSLAGPAVAALRGHRDVLMEAMGMSAPQAPEPVQPRAEPAPQPLAAPPAAALPGLPQGGRKGGAGRMGLS